MTEFVFVDELLKLYKCSCLTLLAEAVSYTRQITTESPALNELGEAGFNVLIDIWLDLQDADNPYRWYEGSAEYLADLIPLVYALLIREDPYGEEGLMLYLKLDYMMSSLLDGEWFEFTE